MGPPEPHDGSRASLLKSATSAFDKRCLQGRRAIPNFSRPLNPTTHHIATPDGFNSPVPLTSRVTRSPHTTDPFFEPMSPLQHTPPCQRSVRPSSSPLELATSATFPLPSRWEETTEPGHHPTIAAPSTYASAPTTVVVGDPENLVSTPTSSPVFSRAISSLSEDDVEYNFESSLTTSTTSSIDFTETGSVFTEHSSIGSLGSLEDATLVNVLDLYEKGFADHEGENKSVFNGCKREGILNTTFTNALSSLPMDHCTAKTTQSMNEFVGSTSISSLLPVNGAFENMSTNINEPQDSGPSIELDNARSKGLEATVDSLLARFKLHSVPVSASTLPRPDQTENPGTRDRYGFKKANRYISKEQYDAWDGEYAAYIARRRCKWKAYLQDCALITENPTRFPPRNGKTKRFVRKGIPPDWRGAAWFYYAGGPAILAKHAGLYQKLLQKTAEIVDVDAIERDLHRTFPDNIQFTFSTEFETKSYIGRAAPLTITGSPEEESFPNKYPVDSNEPPIITSLRRVLQAFSVYNPNVGYCQGLNFVAGLLLLFVETEEQCFWLLNIITVVFLPGTHDKSLEGSKLDLGVLMIELRNRMPTVWDRITGELDHLSTCKPHMSITSCVTKQSPVEMEQSDVSIHRLPPITLGLAPWFMSCYIGSLPIETTLRVWDVLFYEGSKTLFRVALAIFKIGENEVRAVKDSTEMFEVVQAIPRRMLDANSLLQVCYQRRNGFGHLSQEDIDKRRQKLRNSDGSSFHF